MDKIPPEILRNILIQLDLQERLICLTVCTRWWNVLDKGALFYSLIITSVHRFIRFMDTFDRLPGYAIQVKEISINHLADSDFTKRNIFAILPNVCIISFQGGIHVPHKPFHYINKYTDVVYFKPKLEHLSEIGGCVLVSQVLRLNLGSRLKTLNLELGFSPDDQNVVSQLKDLPVL